MKNIPVIRLVITALLMVVALALTFLWVRTGTQQIAPVTGGLIPVTEDAFAGPYSLSNHKGEAVSEKSWPGKYKLIYFGFTYCPAICPTELQKITYAMNALGDKAAVIQPLFITVDPDRDTVAKMKDYVALFHPSLVGLTGTPEQTVTVLKTFKIYAAKVQEPGMSDYTMDHSSFIYFIAPDGRLLHIYKMNDTAETMTTTIRQWLEQEQLR